VMSRIPVVVINTLTPLLPSYIIVASMRGFMSMFSMIDVPLRQSYLMGVVGSRRRASAAGFVSVVSRFIAAGAPILTGYFFQYVSTSLPFYIAASFQFLSCSLMYVLFRDIRPPEER
jgi:MFS family permease